MHYHHYRLSRQTSTAGYKRIPQRSPQNGLFYAACIQLIPAETAIAKCTVVGLLFVFGLIFFRHIHNCYRDKEIKIK